MIKTMFDRYVFENRTPMPLRVFSPACTGSGGGPVDVPPRMAYPVVLVGGSITVTAFGYGGGGCTGLFGGGGVVTTFQVGPGISRCGQGAESRVRRNGDRVCTYTAANLQVTVSERHDHILVKVSELKGKRGER